MTTTNGLSGERAVLSVGRSGATLTAERLRLVMVPPFSSRTIKVKGADEVSGSFLDASLIWIKNDPRIGRT